MYYVNENIRDCVRVYPEQGRRPYLRLDMNENPEGLPKAFVDSVLAEITPEYLATYPEPDVFKQKYADYLGVKPENLCLTNGSVMAIRYILETFVKKGETVVTVAPSFEMYWVTCAMLGLNHVGVPYDDDLHISGQQIVDAIDGHTDLVALLNPNNPIGNVFTEAEVRAVIARAREVEAVVVIDEDYFYFNPNSFLPLFHEYDNFIVLRTFYNLCSMAGLRMGIVISRPEIIEYVQKSIPGFEVNTVALLFGERMLDHPELFDQMLAIEQEGRTWIREKLLENGYHCDFGQGNFFFVEPHTDPMVLEKKMREKGILIKTYGKPLLKKYIRISIGSKRVMEQFLEAFLELDQ